jgi:glutamyl endopeptidase
LKLSRIFSALMIGLLMAGLLAFTPELTQAATPVVMQTRVEDVATRNEYISVSNTGEEIDLRSAEATARTSGVDDNSFVPLNSEVMDANKIIGSDQRTQINNTNIFPYQAIVLIVTNEGNCSGYLIGPHTVITAGHCVYDPATGGWATNVKVYAGANGNTIHAPMAYASQLRSVKAWTEDQKDRSDYGAVILGSNLGDTVGWFGWRSTPLGPTDALNETFLNLTGYPGDKPFATMWTHGKTYYNFGAADRLLYHTMDAYHGQSGAPIYKMSHPVCGVCAFAIHTGSTGNMNRAIRIDSTVSSYLKLWKNA